MLRSKLIILLVFFSNITYSQTPNNLVGLWKGRYTRFNDRINPSSSMDYFLDLSMEDGYLVGQVRYENVSDGSKNVTLKKTNVGYTHANGYDILNFDHIEYTSKNQLQITGQTYFKVVMMNGQRIIAGSIRPDAYERGNPRFTVDLTNDNDKVNLIAREGEDYRIIYGNKSATTSGNRNIDQSSAEVNNSILIKGANQLFKDVPNQLSIRDKNYIFETVGLIPKADGINFTTQNAHVDDKIPVKIYLFDINGDAKEEIFVSYSDINGKGRAHSHLSLFIPREEGYKLNVDLDYNAFLPDFKSVSNGYPTLLFGGFLSDLWEWNGSEYVVARKTTSEDFEKLVKFEDFYSIYKSGGSEAVQKKLHSFDAPVRKDITKPVNSNQKKPTMANKRSMIAKKGSAVKFLGKWYASAHGNEMFTISRQGASYTIYNKNQQWQTAPKLVYNGQTDRLEGWAENNGIKIKLHVIYDYQNNELTLKPATKGFGYDIILVKAPIN
jgi:hypothetical protein